MISIIVPVYNVERYIKKCLLSICNQSYKDFECLIVDDGSKDNSINIAKEVVGEDDRFLFFTKENGGLSDARNFGLEKAKGEYVCFIDSDDYVDPQSLREIEYYAKNHKSDVVIVSGGRDDNGKIDYNTNFLKQEINYAANDRDRIALMESALSVGILPKGYKQYFSLGAPYCKLLSVDYLRNKNLLFDENVKFAEDTLFSLQIYLSANDIRYLDVNLYYYVNNTQSATRRFRPGLSKDMDMFFDRICAFIDNNNLWDSLEKAFYLRAEFEVGNTPKKKRK